MAKNRRTYSAEFKAKVVLELIAGDKGLMQASREYGIKDTVLSRWKQEFLAKAPRLFGASEAAPEDDRRIAELERKIGQLTMQLELSKKVLSFANSAPRDEGRS
jgi:transposase-like protein